MNNIKNANLEEMELINVTEFYSREVVGVTDRKNRDKYSTEYKTALQGFKWQLNARIYAEKERGLI